MIDYNKSTEGNITIYIYIIKQYLTVKKIMSRVERKLYAVNMIAREVIARIKFFNVKGR